MDDNDNDDVYDLVGLSQINVCVILRLYVCKFVCLCSWTCVCVRPRVCV